jgi:drug/metabolite transporter (DMT)-like permease
MLAAVVLVVVSFGLFFSVTTMLYGPLDSYLGLSPTAMGVFLLGGVVGSSMGRLVLYVGIDRVGASVNTAVVNTRPLFATILAVALLGESLSIWIGVGTLTIAAGVVLLSLSRGGDIRGWHTYELGFPLLAAVAYAAGNVIRRYGFTTTEADVLSAFVLNEFAAMGILVVYTLLTRGPELFSASRGTYAYFAGGGVLSSFGLLFTFLALSRGAVVIVDPLVGTAPLFAVLFTYLLLKNIERITRGVVLGAVFVIIGAVFIALA